MSSDRPVLIFVAGPQQGQRIVIDRELAVAGRSAELPILLTEDYVSRRQFQLSGSQEGWILENLSSNGTMVNHKRYKAGKQILLGTGDVIGVGLQSEILFVSPGDDADEALSAHRKQHAEKAAAKPPKHKPEAKEEPPAAAEIAPAAPLLGVEGQPTKSLTEEQVAAAAKRARYKKYAIFLGIYLLGLLAVVLVLANRSSEPGEAGSDYPPRLTDAQIEDALIARPDVSPNATIARVALEKARALYDNNPWYQPGGLYECLKQYKQYLAYKGGVGFDDPTDEPKYMEILKNGRRVGVSAVGGQEGLLVKVKRDYTKAWEMENAGRWREALDALEDILVLVPEQDNQDPTYEQLLVNVFKHRQFVKSHLPTRRR